MRLRPIRTIKATRSVRAAAAISAAAFLLLTSAAAAQATTTGPRVASTASPVTETSVTLDWFSEAVVQFGFTSSFDGVDTSRLTQPLPDWLWLRSEGLSVNHLAHNPWNAPSDFDVPYTGTEFSTVFPTPVTGVIHVHMTNMPTPPKPATIPPGPVSNVDLTKLWAYGHVDGSGWGIQPVTAWSQSAGDDRKIQPLNATMAKYFTVKTDSTGELLNLSGKKNAPKLPLKYWTLDWFAVDYIVTDNAPDPTMATGYGDAHGGVTISAARQLRFKQPTVQVATPKHLEAWYSQGTHRQHNISLSSANTLFRNVKGVQAKTVRVEILKSSAIYKDFQVRKMRSGTTYVNFLHLYLRDGHALPKRSSFRYRISATDLAGKHHVSKVATVKFRPGHGAMIG